MASPAASGQPWQPSANPWLIAASVPSATLVTANSVVSRDDAEGVAADVGGAGGAKFNHDVAGVLGRAGLVEAGVFAQA